MDFNKCVERIDYYSNLNINKLKKQIKEYLLKCKEQNINFPNFNRENEESKEIISEYKFLDSNSYYSKEYFDGRQVNEFKMLQDVGKDNDKNWFIIVEYDMDLSIYGYDEIFLDKMVTLMQKLYKLQNELGFLLCIKCSESAYKKCGLEIRTHNVEYFEVPNDLFRKYPIRHCKPWYLFLVPK
jgi:hypothetical protein